MSKRLVSTTNINILILEINLTELNYWIPSIQRVQNKMHTVSQKIVAYDSTGTSLVGEK